MKRRLLMLGIAGAALTVIAVTRSRAVEIPLEALTPARIGFVDLQKVFDTYPEKAFAEGDLLREIEKRKRELGARQSLISTIKQQISTDQTVLDQGRSGAAVTVPANNVPDQTPPPPQAVPVPAASSTTVKGSTPTAVEPYPTEDPLADPLAGLPGHNSPTITPERVQGSAPLPGMSDTGKKGSLLDNLAASNTPAPLSAETQTALQKRIDDNKKLLERKIAEFKNFRGNAVADMKVLETQKTYGVMSRIYAVLQTLARDEGVTVVMDKSYVLYGEDTVDLSDKLIERLQQGEQ